MMVRNKETFKKPMEMVLGTLILKRLAHWRMAAWEDECKQSLERIYLPPASFAQVHELLLKGHGTSKTQTREGCTIPSLTTVTMAIF